MRTIAPDSRLYVVVGILRTEDSRFLIQQRLPGKPCAGQWEFPGGKVEVGESPRQALDREFREELDIEVVAVRPLLQLPYDYEHARVWLDISLIDSFRGEVVGREGQQVRWLTIAEIRQLDILPAVQPILDLLHKPGIQ